MKPFVLIEELQEFNSVKYYTVRKEIEEITDSNNEVEKFFLKFENSEGDIKTEFDTIIALLEEIGKRGAKSYFFRNEQMAFALPSNPSIKILDTNVKLNSKLRLYCVLVTENIVILCNGDVKTADKVQDCPNVLPHFRFANSIAKKIEELRRDLDIVDKNLGEEIGFYL